MTDLEIAESLSPPQRAALRWAAAGAQVLNHRAADKLVARGVLKHRSGHFYDVTPAGQRVIAHLRRLEASK